MVVLAMYFIATVCDYILIVVTQNVYIVVVRTLWEANIVDAPTELFKSPYC